MSVKKYLINSRKKLKRIVLMDRRTILKKAKNKINFYFGFTNIAKRIVLRTDRYIAEQLDCSYQENPEVGALNIKEKIERVENGGTFEPIDIELVNRGAVELIGNAKNILEIGCGTGMFSSMASKVQGVSITASEFDKKTLEWAQKNRTAKNINFCNISLDDVEIDSFDLVVSLEVVEHIQDYANFISKLSNAAPRAIISTPNKNCSIEEAYRQSPGYHAHVREWTAGEFYWVLRVFYKDVKLFTVQNWEDNLNKISLNRDIKVKLKCVPLQTREPQIIAICEKPYRN